MGWQAGVTEGLYYGLFFVIMMALEIVMKKLLIKCIDLQKKVTFTSYEMGLINVLFFSKFLKTSIIVLLVNIVFYRDIGLFENGGLVLDLIVINFGRLITDFFIGFLFDYEFIYKKLKHTIIKNKVLKVRNQTAHFADERTRPSARSVATWTASSNRKDPLHNKVPQIELNSSYEGVVLHLSINFVTAYLPLANALFFQIICPYFLLLAAVHILMVYATTHWTLLFRAMKPSAIMGSQYLKEALKFLNIIFTFQGFGLLFFDVYFGDFSVFTLLVFLYSFVQLINLKNALHTLKKKYFEYSMKKKMKNMTSNVSVSHLEAPFHSLASPHSGPTQRDPSIRILSSNLNKQEPQNQDEAVTLLSDPRTPFAHLQQYFVDDYDRLNPVSKDQAISKYNDKFQPRNRKKKGLGSGGQKSHKNAVFNGMMSTVLTAIKTGINAKSFGLGRALTKRRFNTDKDINSLPIPTLEKPSRSCRDSNRTAMGGFGAEKG